MKGLLILPWLRPCLISETSLPNTVVSFWLLSVAVTSIWTTGTQATSASRVAHGRVHPIQQPTPIISVQLLQLLIHQTSTTVGTVSPSAGVAAVRCRSLEDEFRSGRKLHSLRSFMDWGRKTSHLRCSAVGRRLRNSRIKWGSFTRLLRPRTGSRFFSTPIKTSVLSQTYGQRQNAVCTRHE